MFAQATQLDGDFTLKGMLFLMLIAQLASVLTGLFRRGGSEKREVTINPDIATRVEMERHVAHNREEHAQLFAKLGGIERGLREEMREDVGELHEKLNVVGLGVARLESESNARGKILEQMHEDIRQFMRRDI